MQHDDIIQHAQGSVGMGHLPTELFSSEPGTAILLDQLNNQLSEARQEKRRA